ncbi:hypothetical protein AHMF7605_28955 [Adhaeribacter arboris]|uniref:Uncharacterized protein n=1 Tax=Adhaeribacter arboris TaxID=2072846 RepID=A0A2T2Y8T6_9BACT|nr:hypothetical protein [Adhaeribacter arboris]PSR51941.1 hypothetical protein AHMF7605_28955 [Adhaeribacter arboris]
MELQILGYMARNKAKIFFLKLFKIVTLNGDIAFGITNNPGHWVNLFVAELGNGTYFRPRIALKVSNS